MTHPLSFAGISIFSPEISSFCYVEKSKDKFHFNTILLNIIESLEIVLINMIAILMMPAKFATPGLLKIKL